MQQRRNEIGNLEEGEFNVDEVQKIVMVACLEGLQGDMQNVVRIESSSKREKIL